MLDANVAPPARATEAVRGALDAAADDQAGVERALVSMGRATDAETCERRHVSGSTLASAAALGVLLVALTFAVTAQIQVANAVPSASSQIAGGTVVVGPVTTRIAAAAPVEPAPPVAEVIGAPLSIAPPSGGPEVASASAIALPGAGDEEFALLLMDADVGVAGLEALRTWRVLFDRVVGSGDSLLAIAYEFDTSVSAITVYNDLPDSDHVYTGQALVIPVGFRLPLP